MIPYSVILLLVGLVAVSGFPEEPSKYQEGPCVHGTPVRASRDVMDTFKYASGMSKFLLNQFMSFLPGGSKLRDDEIYYDFCPWRNYTSKDHTGAVLGFGGKVINTVEISTRPGIYQELSVPNNGEKVVDVITLTDHKTFAFITQCFTKANLRAWNVISYKPGLDKQTQRKIEEHAVSLGFKRENVVFFQYHSCKAKNPLLEKFGRSSPSETRKDSLALRRISIGGLRSKYSQNSRPEFNNPHKERTFSSGWTSEKH